MSALRFIAPVVAALAALPATAQPVQGVPEALRGAWFIGECRDPEAMLLLSGRAAARLDAEGPASLNRFTEARQHAGWTLGIGGGLEAPRLLLRPAGTGLETVEPDAKLRDDRLPGDTPPTTWHRCEATPPALTTLHGEGYAVMAALEHLEAACGSGTPGACAQEIVRQADVSGDGKLASAELARLARGAAWVVAAQEGSTQDMIAGAVGAGAVVGILSARLLLESLDYDGDGRLSAEELAMDRAAFAPPRGTAEGRPLRTEGLAEGAGMLRGLIEGLIGSR